MDSWETVALPHGFWVEGKQCSKIELRAVNSSDDGFLLESGGLLPAQRANELVSRCARPSGNVHPAPADFGRSLVEGDLEAVLLHLHRLTFGNELLGAFRCPSAKCGESLELDLRVDALLLPAYPQASEYYVRSIALDNSTYELQFRLPNAEDMERVAGLARAQADDAAKRILEFCVQRISGAQGTCKVGEFPQSVLDAIAEAMAALDPQAVTELVLVCPACQSSHTAQLNAADFLLRKLDYRADQLLREIHALALSYHWSEEAILRMPATRRQKYLQLISSGVGAAVWPIT